MKRFAVLLSLCAFSAPAFATDYLTGYVGGFDVFNNGNQYDSMAYGAEYRYKDIYHGLRPMAGIQSNTDGAVYGYAGIHWDVALSENILLSPNFAAGGYSKGSSKDLGYGLEFKSGVEAAYQFDSGHRIGVALNHMSNASLGDNNPGTEQVLAVYSYPIGWAE